MANHLKVLLVLFIFCLAGSLKVFGQSPNPGFSGAVFDLKDISKLLSRGNCDSIRFYNVIVNSQSGEGSAMAIGVDRNGADINRIFLVSKPYYASDGLRDDEIRVTKLSTREASSACENMQNAHRHSYSAGFSKSVVSNMMSLNGCQGLQVLPHTSGKELSMQLQAIKIESGKVVALGTGSPYQYVCAKPCPSFCGPASHYVYRP